MIDQKFYKVSENVLFSVIKDNNLLFNKYCIEVDKELINAFDVFSQNQNLLFSAVIKESSQFSREDLLHYVKKRYISNILKKIYNELEELSIKSSLISFVGFYTSLIVTVGDKLITISYPSLQSINLATETITINKKEITSDKILEYVLKKLIIEA